MADVDAMRRRARTVRRVRRSGAVAIALFLVSSCTSSARATPRTARTETTWTAPVDLRSGSTIKPVSEVPARLARVSNLTALGDSVPFGTACDCTPYPQLAAAEIASIARRTVHAFNDAGPGLLSNDVLQQVRSDPAVTTDVENADVVLIEVGANDVAFSSACGTDVACYRSKLPRVTTNIAAIVSRVRQLTSGRRVAVVMLDYWNVWLGGQYARAKGTAYTEAANGLTETFGEAIRAEAVSSGSIFVDLRTAFRGPDHDHDETALLSGDGDHPNAEGHERIAETIMQALATG